VPKDDGYFDERVAAWYDASAEVVFETGAVDPVVDFVSQTCRCGS
jgi:hypothetical protein